ncbi:MAG: TonB-dependent siderophore receptor [Turneriella sp.]
MAPAINPTSGAVPEVAPKNEAQLDEVVVQGNSRVTGSKTDVPVHDTPASIISVPKEVIEDQMAVDMNSMVRNVSGVNPQLAGGYGFADSYTIRGLNMRFLRDGFSDGAAFNGYMRTMTDVESIEVLKGPGSALYGRNEPGGVINVTTKKPLDKFAASGEVMTGFWNTYRIAADVGGPLVKDKLLTRFNTAYYKTDGYRGLSREIIEVLPTVTWNFNEKHALTLDYDFRRNKTTPDNFGILFDAGRGLAPVNPSTTYYSPLNKAEQMVNRTMALYEGKFSSAFKLRSALIYDDRKIDFVRNAVGNVNSANIITGRDLRVQSDKTSSVLQQNEAVFKFLTGEVAHTLLAGIEFEYARLQTKRDTYTGFANASLLNPVFPETDYTTFTKNPAGNTSWYDRLLEAYTYSAYAQEQVTITKQIKARAGVRWDHVEASDVGNQAGNQRTIAMARDLISWQVGAVYQPWQPVSFYTGYSEGRYIQLNSEATALFVNPETSTQIEAGNKTSWFKDRLQTNLAYFHTIRANYAVTDSTGIANLLAGKRISDGVELDVSGSPIAGLWLIFNSTYMYSRISGAESAIVSGVLNSLDGKAPQYIPDYSGSFWATYELQSGFLKGLGFGGGPTFKSGVYVDALNLFRVPGYIVADAVLFYKRQNWLIQVNFRNITNEIYYATPSFNGALPSEPFNFTISAKARI